MQRLSGAAPGARRQAVLLQFQTRWKPSQIAMTTLNTVGPVPNAPWRLQRKVAAKAAQAIRCREGQRQE